MKVRYDVEADVVYIRFREGKVAESDEIREGLIIDYDAKGVPLAIELLDAKEILAHKPEIVIDFPWVSEDYYSGKSSPFLKTVVRDGKNHEPKRR